MPIRFTALALLICTAVRAEPATITLRTDQPGAAVPASLYGIFPRDGGLRQPPVAGMNGLRNNPDGGGGGSSNVEFRLGDCTTHGSYPIDGFWFRTNNAT